MLLKFTNLDAQTRKFMVEEIISDIAQPQKFYLSLRLSDVGRNDYPLLIRKAAELYDDEWLANELHQNGRLNEIEQRRTKTGITNARLPYNAHEVLAEGEFNRFYIRGLCRRALDSGIREVEVYRAKEVTNPRPESQAKIGSLISADSLLNDLRNHPGVDTALGLPAGPNSGLSVKLP